MTTAVPAILYAGLPTAVWVALLSMMIGGFVRATLEWQLRRTLAEIFQRAPGGSIVVIRNRGLGGSMWVQVGSGPVPGSRPPRAELQ